MESGAHPPQQAIHDLVPGTVRLFDSDGNDISGGELLLSPAPSTDPEDPLNWSTARKHLSLANVSLFTVLMGYATGCLFSIYVPYSESSAVGIQGNISAISALF
ncbi:hypothetical protein BCR35DRAFT_331676 [Leucosporidium creatinivorum]|uniref:Major facilitator superfamily (MFS) profile domain-containing protein n=1 Tax=Leucosporidium creatinivorum TaxID=106004 RepID=A0A1Y2FD79_9BASI|nr:hypothetical protein BCR35DRAFT_331676 [Leucosporidium creatinivorum]